MLHVYTLTVQHVLQLGLCLCVSSLAFLAQCILVDRGVRLKGWAAPTSFQGKSHRRTTGKTHFSKHCQGSVCVCVLWRNNGCAAHDRNVRLQHYVVFTHSGSKMPKSSKVLCQMDKMRLKCDIHIRLLLLLLLLFLSKSRPTGIYQKTLSGTMRCESQCCKRLSVCVQPSANKSMFL